MAAKDGITDRIDLIDTFECRVAEVKGILSTLSIAAQGGDSVLTTTTLQAALAAAGTLLTQAEGAAKGLYTPAK